MKHGNQPYLSHFFKAMRISSHLMAGSAYSFVHAFVPVIFQERASGIVKKLHGEFLEQH